MVWKKKQLIKKKPPLFHNIQHIVQKIPLIYENNMPVQNIIIYGLTEYVGIFLSRTSKETATGLQSSSV